MYVMLIARLGIISRFLPLRYVMLVITIVLSVMLLLLTVHHVLLLDPIKLI